MQAAPTSIDVQDFQFKLHCRIKVFENENVEAFKNCCNLVAAASRFGLVFIGLPTSELLVIHTKTIEGFELKDGDLTECPTRKIGIASPPSFISVNCDCTKVAVVVTCDGCANVVFYDVASFLSKIVVSCSARLSATPGVRVSDVSWNPVIPNIFTACKNDGTLGLYELSNSGISISELPAESGATSMCWSPKGKQIAVGSRDGKITQYKPDLKAARVIDSPPLESGTAVIALQWISNYQFIGIYNRAREDGESNACLIVVNAPKVGATTFVNYEDDLYYSSGVARMPQFYTLLESHWNVLMIAYSNCMEIGLMGSEGEKWTQWILDDSTRAELPLSSKKQETFPVGLAIDVAAVQPIPWGESSLPPAPFLYMLSTYGVLSCWRVVNVRAGVGTICSPPENLPDTGGLVQFTKTQPTQAIIPQQPPPSATFANLMPSQPTAVASMSSILPQNTVPKPTAAVTKPPTFGTLSKPETQSATFGTGLTAMLSKPPTFVQPFGTTQLQSPPQLNLGAAMFAHKPPLLKVPEPQSTPKTPVAAKPADEKPPVTALSPSLVNISEARVVQEETDALISKMIFEEVAMLDAEVNVLLHKAQSVSVHLGTDEEGINLVTNAESLQEFLKDVADTTNGQAAEVHALKNGLIENWALFEDARLRHVQSRDAEMGRVLRTQPLDPASKRNLAEIEHLQYYLESQIIQANAVMDDQWEAFQDSCRSTLKTKVPTMEAIYQTMVRESVILQKHKYVLKDLSRRIQAQRAKGPSTVLPLLVSHDNPDKLDAELRRLTLEPKNASEATYQRVQQTQKKLTVDKLCNLRNVLVNRKVSAVTVSKPLPSITPAGLVATPKAKPIGGGKLSALPQPLTSLMGATLSPIPNVKQRIPVPKQLGFIQSTPHQQKINKTDDTKAAAADIVKPTFSFGSVAVSTETSSFGLNIASTQTKPVVMVSSGGSAFVPTTHLQTALKQPDPTKPPAFHFSATTTAESKGFQPLFSTSTLAFQTNTISSSASGFTVPATSLFAFTAKPNEPPAIPLKATPATTDLTAIGSNSNAFSAAAAAFSMGKTLSTPTTTAARPTETSVTKSTDSSVPPATSAFSFGAAFETLRTKTSPLVSATVSTTSPVGKPAQATSPKSPTAATTASIFGQEARIGTGSIFGGVSSSGTTSVVDMWRATTSSTSTAGKASTGTTMGSLFGQTLSAGTSTTGSIFGQTTSTTATTTAGFGQVSSTPVIGTTSTTSSIFDKPLSSISTTGSIFGQTTSTGSIFGQLPSVAVSSTATTGSIFAQAASTPATASFGKISLASSTGSIFAQVPSVTASNTVTTSSVFEKTPTITSTTGSIFGQNTSVVSTTISQAPVSTSTALGKTVSTTGNSGTIFGQVSSLATSSNTDTAGPVFGGKPGSSIIGTTGSTFGQITPVVSTPIATTPSFGLISSSTTNSTAASLGSVFGDPVSSASSTTASIFGQTVSTPTTSALPISKPVDGTLVSTPVATTSEIFAPPTSSGSLFSQPVSTTTGFNQLASTPTGTTSFAQPTFGQPASTAMAFGQPSSTFTVSTSGSLFGQPAGAASTSGSIFGKAASTFVNSGNLFAAPAAVSSASPSIFGSPTPATTQVFGSPQATSPTFGSPALSTSAASGSVFGAPATSSAFGVFGSPTTSAPAFGIASPTPVFGSPTSSSAFGATGTSNASPGFGGKPAFGSGGSVFGSPPAFGGSTGFGSPTSANAFGGGQNAFGSSTSSASSFSFASAASNLPVSSSGFGVGQSNFGFGGLNVGGSAGFGTTTSSDQNPFAPKTSFGTSGSLFATPASSVSSSIFGGGSSTAFGSSSPGFGQQSTFGQTSGFGSQSPSGGPFSGNTGSNQSVAQSGFGAFGQSPKPTGFGAAPVFGGSPNTGFGTAPNFGNTPAFGGGSQFGSPSKVFGASEAPGAFGTATQQNATFANLANQNTIGFGALAQQSQTSQASSPPSFSGGSSFSSWR